LASFLDFVIFTSEQSSILERLAELLFSAAARR
jgi:hypothetical protein